MDSPIAKLEKYGRTRSKSVTANLPLPETLRLPDGREFKTRELIKRASKSEHYNLRSKEPSKPTASKSVVKKYADQDWVWMLTATIEEIQNRYQVNNQYAQVLRSKARNFVKNNPHYE